MYEDFKLKPSRNFRTTANYYQLLVVEQKRCNTCELNLDLYFIFSYQVQLIFNQITDLTQGTKYEAYHRKREHHI